MDRDRDDRARELEATHARAEKRRATSDATARRTRERNEREGRKNNHAVRARDDEEEEEEDALDARARGQSTISDEVARYFCVADEVSVDVDDDDDDARAQGNRAHSGWTVWESNRGQVLGGAKTTKTGEVASRAGGGVESSARARVNEGGGEDARGMMDDRS